MSLEQASHVGDLGVLQFQNESKINVADFGFYRFLNNQRTRALFLLNVMWETGHAEAKQKANMLMRTVTDIIMNDHKKII